MNTCTAKKILCYPIDPRRKPSACTPYHDAQIVEASRVHRQTRTRAARAHPQIARMDLTFKWDPTRPTVWRSKWRPWLNGYRSQGGTQ